MSLEQLDDKGRIALGRRIEQARNKARLTLAQLAERAGYDERTVRNVIKGQKTRIATVEDICDVLQIRSVADDKAKSSPIADEMHGGYTLKHFDDYIGRFHAYRRSFTFPKNLVRSLYEITWSDEQSCLVFTETQRYRSSEMQRTQDYSQQGEIFISNTIGLLHLLTREEGALRLITLTKLRLDDQALQGIVLTQAQGPFYYQPSVSPIFLRKLADADHQGEQPIGPIRPGDADYDEIDRALADIEKNIGIFALGRAT
jgi:transcriptional regulator with XRE-family HTH domain